MARKHIRVLGNCVNLVSCSQSIADKLDGIGIPSRVICNGVTSPNTLRPRTRSGDKLNMITVGSLIPRKNVQFLLSVVEQLSMQGLECKLKVLGDGPLREALESKATSDIEFLGNVDDVAEHLITSDLFISSSLSEGLPNAVLEALSCGLPVLLSDIPPHKEIVQYLPSHAFRLFAVSTDAEYVARDFLAAYDDILSAAPTAISSVARDHFSAKAMSKNYQQVYKALLNDSKL
jgi:glycosyltransferase involved in cell wall biosynthesis